MLNKFKITIALSFLLLVIVSCCGMVSAHEGDNPPEISIIKPGNNQNISGTADIWVSLDHSHTGTPNTLNITITGQNVSYNKKIQLSLSNFNNNYERWTTIWDTSDAPNGKYSIKAECVDIYGVSSSTINVNLNNIKQNTKIELNNLKGINNQDVTISTILRDSSNKILVGKTIQFIVGGKTYTAQTDNGGIAKITYKGTIGTYNITAKFLGDNIYASSEKISILTISSSGSVVKVISFSVDKGKVAQLKATLTNSVNNKPLSSQTVKFTVNGVVVGCNTTNNNGVAIYNYKVPLNGGKYTILASSSDGIVNSGTLTVYQSSMYLKISTDNSKPSIGNKITLYYRIINDGPNSGTNTVFTYKIPSGFKFVKASKDSWTYTYNSKTKTINWKLSSGKVGTSLLKITVKVTNSGKFLLKPKITTDTYDNSLQSSLSNIYLRTDADLTIVKVKRRSNTYKVTIKNKGGLDSGASYLKISYKIGKKTVQKTYKIKGIAAGKSITINAKFLKYSTHKKYAKTLYINYNKKILESSYNNNKKIVK